MSGKNAKPPRKSLDASAFARRFFFKQNKFTIKSIASSSFAK
nr:MAG TPA: hypothetical protein [Caudoviricetes sp.]DAL03224.1 MAG TPA: hypothetical protein [Caudoviricetes sp.]